MYHFLIDLFLDFQFQFVFILALELEERCTTLQFENQTLTTENRTLRAKLHQTRDQITNKQQADEALRKELNELKEAAEQNNSEMSQLRQQLEVANNDLIAKTNEVPILYSYFIRNQTYEVS